MKNDHLGIEIIGVSPNVLYSIALTLKEEGFNYLQCQGGYDEGPGEKLVCVYHLIEMSNFNFVFIKRNWIQCKSMILARNFYLPRCTTRMI